MRMSLITFVLVFVLALAARAASGATPLREVGVHGGRVHLGDLMPKAPADARNVDLGPSPSAGGSRIVDRSEIERALRDRNTPVPAGIPDAVRVVRRTVRLAPQDLESSAREAIAKAALPEGVSLTAVRPSRAIDVPEGWTRVTADVTRPPHHAGPFATTVILAFEGEEGVLARVPVAIVLDVSEAAASFDVTRGASIRLVVRRGLIEVSVSGTTTLDADVGTLVPVLVPTTGRVVRARLIDKDHAEPVEGS
jgi:hypothetical protein